eukprot:1339713-Rhodomonas_salina.1
MAMSKFKCLSVLKFRRRSEGGENDDEEDEFLDPDTVDENYMHDYMRTGAFVLDPDERRDSARSSRVYLSNLAEKTPSGSNFAAFLTPRVGSAAALEPQSLNVDAGAGQGSSTPRETRRTAAMPQDLPHSTPREIPQGGQFHTMGATAPTTSRAHLNSVKENNQRAGVNSAKENNHRAGGFSGSQGGNSARPKDPESTIGGCKGPCTASKSLGDLHSGEREKEEEGWRVRGEGDGRGGGKGGGGVAAGSVRVLHAPPVGPTPGSKPVGNQPMSDSLHVENKSYLEWREEISRNAALGREPSFSGSEHDRLVDEEIPLLTSSLSTIEEIAPEVFPGRSDVRENCAVWNGPDIIRATGSVQQRKEKLFDSFRNSVR